LKLLVKFMGPLSREDKEFEVDTILELKEALKKEIGSEWIETVAIAVNDKLVSKLDVVKDGDVLTILPPVCGG